MDEIKLWALAGEAASPVQSAAGMDSEDLLEEILVKNPEMLIPGLTLVGRQTATDGGPLDLLGVDSDGRLVLFELKRGNLSRDAVAQIIDYASDLTSMGIDALAERIAEQSGTGGIEKIEDFADWHAENFGADNLETLLPLRMFLVGLGVDDRTERMVNFLADNGMDISLLTFQGFARGDELFLARQMPVEAEDKPASRPSRRRPNAAERMERIIRIAEENGLRGLFTDACEMFRNAWKNAHNENPVGVGLQFRLQGRTISSRRTYHPYARVDTWNAPNGKIGIVFRPDVIDLVGVDEFKPFIESLEYLTFPRNRDPLNTQVEFQLTRDEWAAHEDALSALAQAVYEAHQALQSAEASERLFNMARASGSNEVIKPALDMFRENWRNPNESYHRLGLELKHASGGDAARAYARIGPEGTTGSMEMVFYRPSVELCREQFAPLLNEIRYQTWPRNRKDNPLEDPQPEIQFLVNAAEWAAHKDKLSALTRAVYEAYQARYRSGHGDCQRRPRNPRHSAFARLSN